MLLEAGLYRKYEQHFINYALHSCLWNLSQKKLLEKQVLSLSETVENIDTSKLTLEIEYYQTELTKVRSSFTFKIGRFES